MADYGFVYCLGNDCMPGVYKIGKTSRSVLMRAAELSSSTSVPVCFDVLFYIETPRMSDVELAFHGVFSDGRISSNREFFKVGLEEIHEAFDNYSQQENLPMSITGLAYGLLEEIEIEKQFSSVMDGKPLSFAEFEEALDGQNQNG